MYKCSLCIHQVKLVVKPCPCLHDGCGVCQTTNSSLDFGQICARHHCWWLVIDAYFESSWAPINKFNRFRCLDGCNGGIDVLGDNISSVQETDGHVFAMPWIALDHLIDWLKAIFRDLINS